MTFEIWKKYSKNKKRTDYIFPRSSSGNLPTNQKMNKKIKEIGRIVGLNRLVSNPKFNVEGKIIKESDTRVPIHSVLSSHIMRRTFIREEIYNHDFLRLFECSTIIFLEKLLEFSIIFFIISWSSIQSPVYVNRNVL